MPSVSGPNGPRPTDGIRQVDQQGLQEGIQQTKGRFHHRAVRILTTPVRALAGKVQAGFSQAGKQAVNSRKIEVIEHTHGGKFVKDVPVSRIANSYSALAPLEDQHYYAAQDVISEWEPLFEKDPDRKKHCCNSRRRLNTREEITITPCCSKAMNLQIKPPLSMLKNWAKT